MIRISPLSITLFYQVIVEINLGCFLKPMRQHGLKRFADYLDMLERAEASPEWQHFINALTTNLTAFFREPHHFEFLEQRFVPSLPAGWPRLRIWSAGCSSGEEPYSIAMSLCRAIPGIHGRDARILDPHPAIVATLARRQEQEVGRTHHSSPQIRATRRGGCRVASTSARSCTPMPPTPTSMRRLNQRVVVATLPPPIAPDTCAQKALTSA